MNESRNNKRRTFDTLNERISDIFRNAGANWDVNDCLAISIHATRLANSARVATVIFETGLVVGTLLVSSTFGSKSCWRRKRSWWKYLKRRKDFKKSAWIRMTECRGE